MKPTLLVKDRFLLAESPVWSADRNSLFWVDIEGKTLNEFDWKSGKLKKFSLPQRVGFLAEAGNEKLILGLQEGLALFDLTSQELSWLQDVEKERDNQRCNDGKCDAQGRLWFGTMDLDARPGAGNLYVFDQPQGLRIKLSGLGIPNGIIWSLNNEKLYHIDSTSRSVKSYLIDPLQGSMTFEKIAVQVPEKLGMPDGMTIDEEGMLWIAHWGGFGVYRWNPNTGQLLSKIDLPVPQVSSCAFGGDAYEYLFITSASVHLTDAEQEKYPLSGSVFVVSPGVKGLPPNKFGVS